MKKSKFTGGQVAFALRQAAVGTLVAEVCRKMGVSEATLLPLEAASRWAWPFGAAQDAPA